MRVCLVWCNQPVILRTSAGAPRCVSAVGGATTVMSTKPQLRATAALAEEKNILTGLQCRGRKRKSKVADTRIHLPVIPLQTLMLE